MATASTYLQLAPEFGGTKFGPFPGVEIRLGSDPTRNDIVLPEALGVLPAHVRVIRQQDGSFILGPTERTATVYVHRNDGRAPKLITTPTAIQAGDSFSVVTAEGPRFIVMVELPQKAGAGGAAPVAPAKAQKPGTAEGVMAEFKRLGMAKFFTTKIGNGINTAWMMVKTGAIFSPRYIVMGLMMLVPMVLAGGASCAAVSFRFQSAQKDAQIEELQSDLDACGGGQGEDPTVLTLTEAILGDREWAQSLEADPEMMGAYMTHLRSVFDRADRFAWVYERKKSDLTTLAGRLDDSLGPELTRVFAYAAAHPGYVPERQWGLLQANSEGARACGRGPLLMTYRQAANLGVAALPDALADAGVATGSDLDAKAALIKATLGSEQREFQNEEIQAEGAGLQGGYQCLYLDGEDERMDAKALAAALGKSLGPKAKGLPEQGTDYWITARLVKYYAADFIIGFEDLSFSRSSPPTVAVSDLAPDQKTFAVENAAEIIARAVAIPCLAVVKKTPAEHLGTPPTLVQCAVLKALVDVQ